MSKCGWNGPAADGSNKLLFVIDDFIVFGEYFFFGGGGNEDRQKVMFKLLDTEENDEIS